VLIEAVIVLQYLMFHCLELWKFCWKTLEEYGRITITSVQDQTSLPQLCPSIWRPCRSNHGSDSSHRYVISTKVPTHHWCDPATRFSGFEAIRIGEGSENRPFPTCDLGPRQVGWENGSKIRKHLFSDPSPN